MVWSGSGLERCAAKLAANMILKMVKVDVIVPEPTYLTLYYPFDDLRGSSERSEAASGISSTSILARETSQKTRISPGNPGQKGIGGCSLVMLRFEE